MIHQKNECQNKIHKIYNIKITFVLILFLTGKNKITFKVQNRFLI